MGEGEGEGQVLFTAFVNLYCIYISLFQTISLHFLFLFQQIRISRIRNENEGRKEMIFFIKEGRVKRGSPKEREE